MCVYIICIYMFIYIYLYIYMCVHIYMYTGDIHIYYDLLLKRR